MSNEKTRSEQPASKRESGSGSACNDLLSVGSLLDESHYFECGCGSDEHTLRFVYDKDENELYLSVFLNQWRPWWKRLWIAVKYVFGYKCRYGHWDNWVMHRDDASRLRALADKLAR